jgi:hypothetical protein
MGERAHYASGMRTAVIRINVDPSGTLSETEIEAGVAGLLAGVGELGIQLVHPDLRSLAPSRRELQFLAVGEDPVAVARSARDLCRRAFRTEPAEGTTTFISRGTDEDALGVLLALGVVGHLSRASGADGWDVVTVRLAEADLRRVPESRIQTALEASLNCEVRIVAT